MDIVERLRKAVAYGPVGAQKEREQAAVEIERLRAVLDMFRQEFAPHRRSIALKGAITTLDLH